MRQLFCLFQFNGDNSGFCNFHCPYCYSGLKRMVHQYNNNIAQWTEAFERLNRDIYFNLSYGEPMGSNGFYDVIAMVENHPTWEINLITNLSYPVDRLINSQLPEEKRLHIIASWHPLGGGNWENFKKHLFQLREAGVEPLVLFVMWPKQWHKWFECFDWLNANNFRAYPRRFGGNFGRKYYPPSYTMDEKLYLMKFTSLKSIRYAIMFHSPGGIPCSAGKDMILVKCNGKVGLCADQPGVILGNLFDSSFKLNDSSIPCPSHLCGGCYGMIHLYDPKFPMPPERLNGDFVSISERISGGGNKKVVYPNFNLDFSTIEVRKKIGWEV